MTSWWLLLVLPAFTIGEDGGWIINGIDVDPPGKYPWQGSLQFLGGHSCGCSLISHEWAVTASHCILVTHQPSLYTVIFGAHDIGSLSEGDPQVYAVDRIIMHENYGNGYGNFPNDIALLRFKRNPVKYNTFTQPIRLPEMTQNFVGNMDCVITGWGYTSGTGGSIPNILQEANTMVITLELCMQIWGDDKVTAGHICLLNNVNSGCMGDSGGPLVCRDEDGGFTLAGLTSWGSSTCKVNYPSVYTDIVYFRQWIHDKTGL